MVCWLSAHHCFLHPSLCVAASSPPTALFVATASAWLSALLSSTVRYPMALPPSHFTTLTLPTQHMCVCARCHARVHAAPHFVDLQRGRPRAAPACMEQRAARCVAAGADALPHPSGPERASSVLSSIHGCELNNTLCFRNTHIGPECGEHRTRLKSCVGAFTHLPSCDQRARTLQLQLATARRCWSSALTLPLPA